MGTKGSKPVGGSLRSSKLFIYIVVNLAVFTDAYIYGLIIPVLPFALVERVNLPESQVQRWIGILLGAYGAGLIVGSRMCLQILPSMPECPSVPRFLILISCSNRRVSGGSRQVTSRAISLGSDCTGRLDPSILNRTNGLGSLCRATHPGNVLRQRAHSRYGDPG